MNTETAIRPMLPLQACASFAQNKEGLEEAYLELLQTVDWSLNPELRCDSLCVLDVLREDISGGVDIADGFKEGLPCERGFVFLLEGLTAIQLRQFVCKVHARRLKALGGHDNSSSGDILGAVPRLVMDTLQLARKSILKPAIERSLGETLTNWRTAHEANKDLAETLLYLTAWGNKPPHEGPLRCKPTRSWEAWRPEPAHFLSSDD